MLFIQSVPSSFWVLSERKMSNWIIIWPLNIYKKHHKKCMKRKSFNIWNRFCIKRSNLSSCQTSALSLFWSKKENRTSLTFCCLYHWTRPWLLRLMLRPLFSLQTASSAIKGAIQLGIGYTVGNLTSKPERDVLMQDFYVVESVFLPR